MALLAPSVADATPRPDYPSWQEVQAAKRSESAKRAEIAKIQAILVELEAQAQALGIIALQRGEDYAQAQDALDAAIARSEHLDEQEDAAKERAETSSLRASQYVSQLARSGGGDLTMSLLFGSSSETDDLLARMGTIDRLGVASNDIVERAVFDRNAVASLANQAELAEEERERLAKLAEEAWKVGAAGGRRRGGAGRRAEAGLGRALRAAGQPEEHHGIRRGAVPGRSRLGGRAERRHDPADRAGRQPDPDRRRSAVRSRAAIAFAKAQLGDAVPAGRHRARRLGLLGADQGELRLRRRVHRHPLGEQPVQHHGGREPSREHQPAAGRRPAVLLERRLDRPGRSTTRRSISAVAR